MMTHVERQVFEKPLHERGAVTVRKPHATELALLRMAVRKREGLRPLILPA